jgi:hypothetical protein
MQVSAQNEMKGVTVLNGTVLVRLLWHRGYMRKSKPKRASDREVLASVKEEMAKPRIAESAQMKPRDFAPQRSKERQT